jgi:dihydropteroate synthase
MTEASCVPAPIRCGSIEMAFGERVWVMGILNVTPDSFSDGGKNFEAHAAIEAGLRLAADGADIIDIGGESTRPGAEPVPQQEELRRVLPVIEGILRHRRIPISVDTMKAGVAEAAVAAGAAMINDVSALRFDPRMGEVAARAGVPLVLMHMRGEPRTMQQGEIVYRDVVAEVAEFLAGAIERAAACGVSRQNIIIDPGIGFGKTVEHNLELIDRLGELRALGRPVLVGPSRKSFIGKILDLPPGERLWGTAAAVAAAVLRGADIVRVHDAREMSEAARVALAVRRRRG